MRRWLLLALLAVPAQDPAPPPEPVPLPLRVNHAIVRGVELLKSRQQPSGHWGGHEGAHPGGLTALCAFTLVKSGALRSDEALARALAALEQNRFKSTYSIAVWLLLLESLGEPARWRSHAQAGVDFLVAIQDQGVWAYPEGEADMSNTQLALLGLLAASRMGIVIPDDTVSDAASALWRWQKEDGGFAYQPQRASTGGMTAATLAGLAALEELGAKRPATLAVIRKKQREREAAEAWLARRFMPERNPYGPRAWTPTWLFEYLWAIERFGGLAGKSELAGRDWYTEGAEHLVASQAKDGAFGRYTEDTCFALLFLRRATLSSRGSQAELYKALDLEQAAAPHDTPRPDAAVPRVTDWLLAGPWQGEPGNALLVEPPFRPERAEAKPGTKLARRPWERLALKPDAWTNLEELTGRGGDHLLWAAATRLVVRDAEPLAACLWLDLEDGWGVWLDGVELSRSQRVQAPIDGDVRVDVDLASGEHLLFVLVEDDIGASAFGMRVTDRAGRALDSVQTGWPARAK
jgi:hypothetical protein